MTPIARGCRRLDRLVGALARAPSSSAADPLGGERAASRTGRLPVLTCAPRISEQRHDDDEDHEQDEPGGAGVRAVEARLAALRGSGCSRGG